MLMHLRACSSRLPFINKALLQPHTLCTTSIKQYDASDHRGIPAHRCLLSKCTAAIRIILRCQSCSRSNTSSAVVDRPEVACAPSYTRNFSPDYLQVSASIKYPLVVAGVLFLPRTNCSAHPNMRPDTCYNGNGYQVGSLQLLILRCLPRQVLLLSFLPIRNGKTNSR